ncbi:MAG: NUDIX hydrolase [Alphaproteobacteria bacterium]|nr:NUDIX hydrolase [Alphaproteobacteria bacterium]
MHAAPTPESPDPVLKIGAVVLRAPLRRAAAGVHILILQPKPKHSGEVPPFVLPRGSRQYRVTTAEGREEWHDARDAATGIAHAATLESFARGLAREIEEEAGITPEQLAQAQVTEMGAMEFQSRSKGVYPIHWFVVQPDAATAATLTNQTPEDALAVRWATLEQIKQMAVQGEFSAGYVPVIEAALALVAEIESSVAWQR